MKNEKNEKYSQAVKNAAERIRSMNLMNDTFASIALNDADACGYVISKILKRNDIKVIKVNRQYRIVNFTAKDTILDILAEDADGRIMNIEIQRTDTIDHARRTRYYSSMLDKDNLDKGEDYDKLPDIYVIYISEKDLWDCGEVICPVNKTVGKAAKPYDDGSYIIYVNAAVNDGSEAAEMMQYFKTADPQNMSEGALSKRVNFLKREKGGFDTMCEIADELLEKGYFLGKDEGKEEGRVEGRVEGVLNSIKNMLQNTSYTIEEAMKILGVPENEQAEYAAML